MIIRKMSSSNIPEIAYCAEKEQLLKEFTHAMRELVAVQSKQIEAVIAGAPNFERFESVIQKAIEKKRQAKYAYLEHVQVHGC